MEIKQQNIDALNAELIIELKKEDYYDQYERALKEQRKKITLPGFRNGHVPMGVVKKKIGSSVLADEINKILNDSLVNYIKENDLKILGNPLPKENDTYNGDWNNPNEFKFIFDVGLSPEINLKLNKLKEKHYKIAVDNAMVDKHINDLSRRYGKISSPELSGDKDMLFGDLIQLDEKDEIVEGGIMHRTTITLEFLKDEPTRKKCSGLKVGDSIVVDPKKIAFDDKDLAALLGIDESEVGEIQTNFKFNITEIKRMIPADVSQELIDKVYGKDKVQSMEAFRLKVKEELSNMFVQDSDRLFEHQIVDNLLDSLKLELPHAFLKRWIIASNEKPITPEQLDTEYDGYLRNLQWQLIENKIIQDNDLKVTSGEVVNYTKTMLINQYRQYKMAPPDEKQLDESAKKILEKQDEARRVYEALYSKKVLLYIKDTIKLSEKELSYDDFVKLASNPHNH